MSGTVPPTPDTTVAIVGITPSSLDLQFQNLAPVPGTGWAGQQAVFPPVIPQVPAYQLPYAGATILFRKWINNWAVLPFPTDPPPCPVVVSRYPGLTW